MKGRTLRYADGGVTPVAGAPQSAFNQTNPSYGSDGGLNNDAPLVAITNAPVGGSGMPAMRKGGKVKKMAKGGTASKRGDGCAMRGKTKGKMV